MLKSRLLIAALAVFPTGCTTLQNQSRVDPQAIAVYPLTQAVGNYSCVTHIPGDTRVGALDLNCLRFPGDSDLAYPKARDDPSARSRLASILIMQSDNICTVEMGRLTADQAMVNTGLSSATTVFSTAGAIVTGQLAGNILSGLASGTNGIRDHINAETYRNTLSNALTKAIRQERDRQRAIIDANSKIWDVDTMIRRVNEYHQVCSFFSGLDLVMKAVDRAGLYAADPRRTAAIAIDNVRGQIASINRQLGRKDITTAETQELVTERTALREHETELVKAWTALPAATTEPDTPDAAPNPAPSDDSSPTDETTQTKNSSGG
jgi:hypothetical protein